MHIHYIFVDVDRQAGGVIKQDRLDNHGRHLL